MQGLISIINDIQEVFSIVGKCLDSKLISRWQSDRFAADCSRRWSIEWQEFRIGEHCRKRLFASGKWNCHALSPCPTAGSRERSYNRCKLMEFV